MIVWVNGAFGSGKTTLAEELQRRLPEALFFDPEYVGYVLRKWVPMPPSGDFQDIPLWRTLVAQFAVGMRRQYGQPLIVPMTLIDPLIRAEILGHITAAEEEVLHVFLEVPAGVLRRRIAEQVLDEDPQADAAARAFRSSNVERGVAARADLPGDTLVLRADLHTPHELAEQVLAAM